MIGLQVAAPSLVALFLLILSYKKLWLVELVNLAFMVVFGLANIAINKLKITGDVTDLQR